MAEKKTDKHDAAVNPKHYSDFGEWATIVIIRRWNAVRKDAGVKPVPCNIGNALKYMQRAGFKPGQAEIQELKKAIWYLQSEVHELDPENEPDPAGVDGPK